MKKIGSFFFTFITGTGASGDILFTLPIIYLSSIKSPKTKTFNFRLEGHIKSFCTNCGSALPNIQMDGRLLVVLAGCMDSDINIKPQGHIFYASKANWDTDLEKVPKFQELPNG